MNFYKKRQPFISLVCVISLLLSVLSIPAAAVDTHGVTATGGTSVAQGGASYCYVNIDSTENLASLEVTVYFDPSQIRITGAYNSISCTLYDSVVETDHIRFSYLLDGKGTGKKTSLFYFYYQVLSNATPGDAYFDITVGEAYDNALQDVPVSGSRYHFTITEKSTPQSCTVSASSAVSTGVGQEFTLSYQLGTSQIASGTTVINYDPELFEVVKVENGSFLADKLVDVNILTGSVYLSFLGTQYGRDTTLVSVTFRTLKNMTDTSTIQFKAPELLDKNLNTISCKGCTTNVNVIFDPTYVDDAPAMYLDGDFSYEDKTITLRVLLEKASHLGAGDFVIHFDPKLVTYRSCTKEFSPSFFHINDKKVTEGQLKFHIISLSDLVEAETVLTVVFDVNSSYSGTAAEFGLTGTGLTDSLTESIVLNCRDTSVALEYQVTFCNENGEILQSQRYGWGDEISIPAPPSKPEDRKYTYTFAGWDKEISTNCYGNVTYTATYEAIPKSFLVGDVTGDGKISIVDVSKLYSYIKKDLTLEDVELSCDVVEDGRLTVLDVAMLYAHVKGTKPLF